ncbi:MAG: FAD-dependent oxidoreductase [Proteobacteria bacterium]|nr:FAD-dependent oxidoreductase [Pseudomonadota bacterium]
MSRTFVIVGAGQAGAIAVETLRREGFDGRLILIGDEPSLPYQRPPLSKKYLAGEMEADRLLFRHAAYYQEHRIETRLGLHARALDPAARRLDLSNGESLTYDRLLLTTGTRARMLSCAGADLGRVHGLRNIADVNEIRPQLKPKARVVIVGGGYIGLETAASARKAGCEVTILEMADRAMNRVVAPLVSDFYMAEHRAHGVKIICNTLVSCLEGGDSVERVACADGTAYEADVVIVGVGAIPNAELARDAGIACENGVRVDEYCRTSDPNVFAAGDCCSHPSPHYGRRLRLESVDNAVEQARTAALNMLDKPTVHDKIPWFWSDQYDLKLLIVGVSQDHDRIVLRGDPATRSFSVCYLKGSELLAVDTINHAKDYMAARKPIAERMPMNAQKLADITVPLKEAVAG